MINPEEFLQTFIDLDIRFFTGVPDSLLKEIRRNHSKTISIKVSPDVSDSILADIGKLCSEYESIIINAGNPHYK